MADGEWLFSCGTLRDPTVQRSLFGREVEVIDDTLTGFILETVAITDPAVIKTSGRDRHPILRRGSKRDEIRGSALLLTAAELAAVDQYEVADYARVSVVLASGRTAHVYIDRSELPAGAIAAMSCWLSPTWIC